MKQQGFGKMYRTAGEDGSWSDYPFPDPKAPKTPWGPAQGVYNIIPGVRWFTTAGHGGLMVSPSVARKMLTPAAVKLGDFWGGAYWYEEDIEYSIPMYEHPEWDKILAQKAGGGTLTQEQHGAKIRQWNPKYFTLLEAGETHLVQPKKGMTLEFLKPLMFGRAYPIRVGDAGQIVAVTGSSIKFNLDRYPGVRFSLNMRNYIEGDVRIKTAGGLRDQIAKLAHEHPEFRCLLVPLLRHRPRGV